MESLLVSLLNLLGLALLVRLTLPARYALLNPYAAAMDTLLARLLGFLRGALPLPPRALCLAVLALALSAQAALAVRHGAPTVAVSAFALFAYPAQGFLGWLGVAALRFFGFYVSVLAAAFLLRVWHLGRPLPGYTGDLMCLVGRPLSPLPLWMHAVGTLGTLFAFVALAEGFASETVWPMAQLAETQALMANMGLRNIFDLSALTPAARLLFLVGSTLAGVAAQAQNVMLMLFLARLLLALLRARPTLFFIDDAIHLLTGPIPAFRLGPLNLAPLAAYFLFGVVSSLFTVGLLLLARVLSHVV